MTSLQETRMFATGRKDVGTTHILNPAVQPRKGFSLWMWHHLAANTYCIKFMCHHSGKDEMQERIYSARKEIAGSKKKKKKEGGGGDFIYHGGWTKTNVGIMTLYFVQSL